MFIALRDLACTQGRFLLMGLVVALVAYLMTFLAGLSGGLSPTTCQACWRSVAGCGARRPDAYTSVTLKLPPWIARGSPESGTTPGAADRDRAVHIADGRLKEVEVSHAAH